MEDLPGCSGSGIGLWLAWEPEAAAAAAAAPDRQMDKLYKESSVNH